MVLETSDEILGAGADLDEVRRAPRTSERNGVLVEDDVDGRRDERLAVSALLVLFDDANDRCMPLGERPLVRIVSPSGWHDDEAEQADGHDAPEPGHVGSFSGRRRTWLDSATTLPAWRRARRPRP